VPIHFKPLLGIVTRKDFYFYFLLTSSFILESGFRH
jgi:hypothetical protein